MATSYLTKAHAAVSSNLFSFFFSYLLVEVFVHTCYTTIKWTVYTNIVLGN